MGRSLYNTHSRKRVRKKSVRKSVTKNVRRKSVTKNVRRKSVTKNVRRKSVTKNVRRKSVRKKSVRRYSKHRGGELKGYWQHLEPNRFIIKNYCTGDQLILLLGGLKQLILLLPEQPQSEQPLQLNFPTTRIFIGNHLCEKPQGVGDRVNHPRLKHTYVDAINGVFQGCELTPLVGGGEHPQLLLNLFGLAPGDVTRSEDLVTDITGRYNPQTVVDNLCNGALYESDGVDLPSCTTLVVTHSKFLEKFITLLFTKLKPGDNIPMDYVNQIANLDCLRIKVIKKIGRGSGFPGDVQFVSVSYHSSETFTDVTYLLYDETTPGWDGVYHTFIFMRHCPACHNIVTLNESVQNIMHNLVSRVSKREDERPVKGSLLAGEASMCLPIMIDHMFSVKGGDFIINHFIHNVLEVDSDTNLHIVCSSSFRTSLTAQCMNMMMACAQNEAFMNKKKDLLKGSSERMPRTTLTRLYKARDKIRIDELIQSEVEAYKQSEEGIDRIKEIMDRLSPLTLTPERKDVIYRQISKLNTLDQRVEYVTSVVKELFVDYCTGVFEPLFTDKRKVTHLTEFMWNLGFTSDEIMLHIVTPILENKIKWINLFDILMNVPEKGILKCSPEDKQCMIDRITALVGSDKGDVGDVGNVGNVGDVAVESS